MIYTWSVLAQNDKLHRAPTATLVDHVFVHEVAPSAVTKPPWLARVGVHDRGRITFRSGGRFHRRTLTHLAKYCGVKHLRAFRLRHKCGRQGGIPRSRSFHADHRDPSAWGARPDSWEVSRNPRSSPQRFRPRPRCIKPHQAGAIIRVPPPRTFSSHAIWLPIPCKSLAEKLRLHSPLWHGSSSCRFCSFAIGGFPRAASWSHGGNLSGRLSRDFPFGLSLEPLQAYFAPHLNIASPPVSIAWRIVWNCSDPEASVGSAGRLVPR